MKLSILILTIPSRVEPYDKLRNELIKQMRDCAKDIELVTVDGPSAIGRKRNKALESSQGNYVAFIDDDDWISRNYIELLMQAIESDCDCASLKGIYYINDNKEGFFEHSIKYNAWKTTSNNIKYERYPNHLNLIRASIAKQFKFPETNHGEDFEWSKAIHESGLLKTEFYIPEVLYYYRKITKK